MIARSRGLNDAVEAHPAVGAENAKGKVARKGSRNDCNTHRQHRPDGFISG